MSLDGDINTVSFSDLFPLTNTPYQENKKKPVFLLDVSTIETIQWMLGQLLERKLVFHLLGYKSKDKTSAFHALPFPKIIRNEIIDYLSQQGHIYTSPELLSTWIQENFRTSFKKIDIRRLCRVLSWVIDRLYTDIYLYASSLKIKTIYPFMILQAIHSDELFSDVLRGTFI